MDGWLAGSGGGGGGATAVNCGILLRAAHSTLLRFSG